MRTYDTGIGTGGHCMIPGVKCTGILSSIIMDLQASVLILVGCQFKVNLLQYTLISLICLALFTSMNAFIFTATAVAAHPNTYSCLTYISPLLTYFPY
jgi:hypothetical protein